MVDDGYNKIRKGSQIGVNADIILRSIPTTRAQ